MDIHFKINKLIIAALVCFSIVLAGCTPETSEQDEFSKIDESRGVPMYDLAGHGVRFSDLKGKWVLVNYWASYCPSCINEIPELNAFYREHKDKDATVLGVSFDLMPAAKLREIVAKLKIEYPVTMQDPALQLGIDVVPGLPTSFLISPEGVVVKRLIGQQKMASLESMMGLGDAPKMEADLG